MGDYLLAFALGGFGARGMYDALMWIASKFIYKENV